MPNNQTTTKLFLFNGLTNNQAGRPVSTPRKKYPLKPPTCNYLRGAEEESAYAKFANPATFAYPYVMTVMPFYSL